jgi:peptide/nickel transport system permease protein
MVLKVVPIQFMRGAISSGVEIGFTAEFFLDALKHVAVPAFVYVLSTAGAWMLIMKSSTISTLGEDYVTTAKARGLSDGRIITAYVGRNAMLPLVTRLAITIGVLVGGSILIETIFTYRGIGLLLSSAMTSRDYPLMQGVFIITTIAVIAANFAADLLYGLLDPRIRTAGGSR